MKNIIVVYESSVISISSAFKKKAFTAGTSEYNELNKVRRDYPDFRIVVRQFQTNTKQDRYKGLTYDYMRWYIETRDKEHAVETLDELENLISDSKCHSIGMRYPTIKAWFLKRYPTVAQFGMDDADENEAA